MCRWQEPKEQSCVSYTMDARDLDQRVMQACSYEALPPSSGSLWSAVIPRPTELSVAQYVPSSDVIDTNEDARSPMHCKNMHWHCTK